MKFYKADSYKKAAWVASKDIENWSEEERLQLRSIAVSHKPIDSLTFCNQSDKYPKFKRVVSISNSGNQQGFVLEGKVYVFHNLTHGIRIEKLSPDPLSQFNNEQLVNELCRRGWEYAVTEISC